MKKTDNYNHERKQLFIIVMSINTSEIMTKQHRYCEKDGVKRKEKHKRYYKENKERLQKGLPEKRL